jgi:hypothetical protein
MELLRLSGQHLARGAGLLKYQNMLSKVRPLSTLSIGLVQAPVRTLRIRLYPFTHSRASGKTTSAYMFRRTMTDSEKKR